MLLLQTQYYSWHHHVMQIETMHVSAAFASPIRALTVIPLQWRRPAAALAKLPCTLRDRQSSLPGSLPSPPQSPASAAAGAKAPPLVSSIEQRRASLEERRRVSAERQRRQTRSPGAPATVPQVTRAACSLRVASVGSVLSIRAHAHGHCTPSLCGLFSWGPTSAKLAIHGHVLQHVSKH